MQDNVSSHWAKLNFIYLAKRGSQRYKDIGPVTSSYKSNRNLMVHKQYSNEKKNSCITIKTAASDVKIKTDEFYRMSKSWY